MSKMIVVKIVQKTAGTVTLGKPQNIALSPLRAKVCGLTIIPRHLPTCVSHGLMLYKPVSTAPGLTSVTWTPYLRNSICKARVK